VDDFDYVAPAPPRTDRHRRPTAAPAGQRKKSPRRRKPPC
jgi:hypothetical protein